jgi:hypothetical protein
VILHCLPSDIDDESRRDMQAMMIVLAARNKKTEMDKEMEAKKWH